MGTTGDKIREAREAKGMAQAELAQALGVTRNAVSMWENDKNGPAIAKLLKLCAVLGISPDSMRPPPSPAPPEPESISVLHVVGDVRAGAWLEIESEPVVKETIPAATDWRYPAPQFALRVVGTSMNKVAGPGQYVIVASWPELGMDLKDGDLVVVRRERAMTYEVTLKRARRGEKGWELWPESTDPKHQEPVALEDGDRDVEVAIVGKVIGRYEPL